MWQEFEDGIYRDRHVCAYAASVISLFVCTYNTCVHTYIIVDPLPCGEILRAVFTWMSWLNSAVTF